MNTLTLSDAAPLTPARAEPARWALGAGDAHRTLRLDGATLAYGDAGSGPTVVCLHAIGHGARDFARLRTLIGNSIGGAVAIRYAAAHPDRVRGLVVENPGGLDGVDRLARLVTGAMAAFFAAGARGTRWYPAAFAAYYRLVLQARPAAADRARIVAAARDIAPVLRDAWRSFGQPDADIRARAATVRCPVLFAWAIRDQFVQLRRSRATIRAMPTARLETFAAGHAPHLETPEAFEASVEAFLAGLPA